MWLITGLVYGCLEKSIKQHLLHVLTSEENWYTNEFYFVGFSDSHFGNRTCVNLKR